MNSGSSGSRSRAVVASALHGAATPVARIAAVSTLAANGRTIFYNPSFLRGAIARVCKVPACVEGVEGLLLAMVAHELAHAYCHPKAAPGHRIEREADYVAGYVLGRARMSPADFVTVLGTFRATMFHSSAQLPGRYPRRPGDRAGPDDHSRRRPMGKLSLAVASSGSPAQEGRPRVAHHGHRARVAFAHGILLPCKQTRALPSRRPRPSSGPRSPPSARPKAQRWRGTAPAATSPVGP